MSSNLLKPKIKQTLVLNTDIDTVLSLIRKQFGASWQIDSRRINSDTLTVRASRKDAEVSLHLERWQGTESHVELDGEVLLKTPYETWREWAGVIAFLAILAIWILLSTLPFTAIPFENLYNFMTKSGNLLLVTFILTTVAIFLGVPFLSQRYFTQLSPDIRLYGEATSHLANFVSELKNLQNIQELDTSRL